VLNTPFGQGTRTDGYDIRQAAITNGVPCITTLSGILAAIQGVEALRRGDMQVHSLQEYQAAFRDGVDLGAAPASATPGDGAAAGDGSTTMEATS
jgi:carbamoyl-phosphate synthase large subunit